MHCDSSVYSCFIDIETAFDFFDHRILLEKLIKSKIPLMFVNQIKFRYSHQRVSVRYSHATSESFLICSGVR